MEVTMKPILPLCIYTLALSGCFTVTVPEETAVADQNQAPTISGSAINEIKVKQFYSFIPHANDEDGDGLTFNIENKPSWGDFNGKTGELSGTPNSMDTCSNIIISVTDGEYSASLSPFNISVLEPTLYEVTLNWQAPTENMDGSDVNEISAYKVFYGNTQGQPNKHTTVNDSSMTTVTIKNLELGDHYFTMSTVSSSGMESNKSDEYFFEITE